MEPAKKLLYFTILWLSVVSAQEVQEPEITTENSEFPSFENATEPPSEVSIPEEFKPAPPTAVEGKEQEPFAVEEQPVVVSFPDNHKNFTPSQYLGDEEYPPYYNHLNSYQQQYKNYYEQKETYNRKPVKFEENSWKNYYLPSDSLDVGDGNKNGGFRVNRNPFPYAFENGKVQETNDWHKNPVRPLPHEQQTNDHVFGGHQEHILPYHVFPHAYPNGEKFYADEMIHFDHHHVKKDEGGNPWKKVFHVLTALVPLGLLLATLTPNVISINSTATAKSTRKRSEDPSPFRFKEEDVLGLMKKYEVESLSEMQCEDRVICELAREGGKTTAGPIEKGFWLLANQTPRHLAEKAGMNELFKAIKTGTCDVFRCHSKGKSGGKKIFGKKIIRKRKIPE